MRKDLSAHGASRGCALGRARVRLPDGRELTAGPGTPELTAEITNMKAALAMVPNCTRSLPSSAAAQAALNSPAVILPSACNFCSTVPKSRMPWVLLRSKFFVI